VGRARIACGQVRARPEADVVLLVDVDGSPHACTPVHLYVAASRARHRLYVFARQGVELPG
jgi:uncharacterized protein with von Willebrand factor type A (vWA) domain